MRRKGLIAVVVAALIAAAYVAGYLPERRARVAAEAEAGTLRARLADAEARGRASEILGRALTLKDAAMQQNYGLAREMSSSFFDAVLDEPARSDAGEVAAGLNDVLAMRDTVTAALAQADPAVVGTLYGIERRLRRALGYPLPPDAASDSTTSP